MSLTDQYRKVRVKITDLDSIPCSLRGKTAEFDGRGRRLTEGWSFPWPMPWVENVLSAFAAECGTVSQRVQKKLYNPAESDQYIEVAAESFIDLTLGALADDVAARYADREALVSSTGTRRYIWSDFHRLTENMAAGLLQSGVGHNSRVAVWAVNAPEYVVAQFAVSKAGAVMVPLNAYEKEQYIGNILKLSEADTLILQVGTKAAENIEILYRICPELCESVPGKLRARRLPALRNVIVISDYEYPGTFRWNDILEIGATADPSLLAKQKKMILPGDIVHMIFTSGTTGAPKGVLLSHKNIIENAQAMADAMALTQQDVLCIQSPMFHCFGCVAGSLTGLISGSAMVMVDKFRSEITLSLIEREKCTVVSGVPTMFRGFLNVLAEQKNTYDVGSIRTGIIAGAPVTPGLLEEIDEKLKIENLIAAYGLTEASPCVAVSRVNEGKLSALKPIAGVSVRIVDHRTREILSPGTQGEIAVSGYNVMAGYYRSPEATKAVLSRDGWLYTGDLGVMTADGGLLVQDRCKDVIIRSGENIAPREIEEILATNEHVKDVCVVGAPHPIYGEELFAFVTPRGNAAVTEEEIRGWLKGKLATYKIPGRICFVDHLPVSASGKHLKKELRLRAEQMVNDLRKARTVRTSEEQTTGPDGISQNRKNHRRKGE